MSVVVIFKIGEIPSLWVVVPVDVVELVVSPPVVVDYGGLSLVVRLCSIAFLVPQIIGEVVAISPNNYPLLYIKLVEQIF